MESPATPALAAAIDASPNLRIPFAEAMRIALYAENVGYYTSGRAAIGKEGDFITSVSAGSCFGTLLARHYIDLWEKADSPASYLAVEQGAHDAQLASDILDALDESHSPLRDAIHFCLVEPDPQFRDRQSNRLSFRLGDRFTHLHSPAELASLDLVRSKSPGVIFANELLDAFPVHLARFQKSTWSELYLTRSSADHSDPPWALVPGPASEPAVAEVLSRLPQNLTEGYTTEVQTPAPARWIREVAATGFRGEICLIDYGFERAEYYAPHRTEGTLRRYFGHKTDGRVLENLGAADLTAHVEWTAVQEAAESASWTLTEFTDQHHFLIDLATPWLRELEQQGATGDTEPRIRQFQTLIHPTSMGRAFQVLRFQTGELP